MASTHHTPGPWQIEGRFQPPGSTDWGFLITAGTNDRQDGPAAHVGDLMVSESDARLITAAPEMLEALKFVSSFDCPSWLQQMATAAIAKAEGR